MTKQTSPLNVGGKQWQSPSSQMTNKPVFQSGSCRNQNFLIFIHWQRKWKNSGEVTVDETPSEIRFLKRGLVLTTTHLLVNITLNNRVTVPDSSKRLYVRRPSFLKLEILTVRLSRVFLVGGKPVYWREEEWQEVGFHSFCQNF